MKKFFCLFFITFLSFSCFAKNIAKSVLIFSNSDPQSYGDVGNYKNFEGVIEQTLTEREDLAVIDLSKTNKVKEEMGFQQSEWSNAKKTAEFGKALNADLLIFISYYNSFYVVQFLNANTFEKITFIRDIDGKKYKDLKKLKKLSIEKLFTVKEGV